MRIAIEGQRGKAFELRETGWGEFDIAIKLYFVAESGEKAQTLYHMLRLHPYGTDETAREAMRASGCVPSLAYEEQLFNEPYEHFYDILSSGAVPTGWSKPLETMSDITSIKNISLVKSGGKGKGGGGGLGAQTPGGVLERSAMIPLITRLPAEPFSRETEQLEVKKLRDAALQLAKKERKDVADLRRKEAYLSKLKADRIAAEKADGTA